MIFDALNDAVIDAFAEDDPVVWLDAPARTRNGVFDSRHYEQESGGEVGVSDLETTLAVKDDPDDPIAVGETLTVHGETWKIVDDRPDGQGMTVYVLQTAG